MPSSLSPPDPSPAPLKEALSLLRNPKTIRERSGQLYNLLLSDRLEHFAYAPEALEPTVNFVLEEIRTTYPDLAIPYHSRLRHLDAGEIPRVAWLASKLQEIDQEERVRIWFDLLIPSVLLDAGAGPLWTWQERGEEATVIRSIAPASAPSTFSRSEGLAVASFYLFLQGSFSSDHSKPWRTDAKRLLSFSAEDLCSGFQVSPSNPLVGLEGRATLLHALGQSLLDHPRFFGTSPPRPGHLYDYLRSIADEGRLSATSVFSAVLEGLQAIWPSRLVVGGVNLGDVWEHPAITGPGLTDRLIPFHKLSQWLTYSLLEPLQEAGLEITDLHALTGLPEYRNGGLFLDTGLLRLLHPAPKEGYLPSHPCIVEWRALTVILLDLLAEKIRSRLGLSEERLPLVAILQGGTWSAGRRIARLQRPDGSPPLSIQSDGTVF